MKNTSKNLDAATKPRLLEALEPLPLIFCGNGVVEGANRSTAKEEWQGSAARVSDCDYNALPGDQLFSFFDYQKEIISGINCLLRLAIQQHGASTKKVTFYLEIFLCEIRSIDDSNGR